MHILFNYSLQIWFQRRRSIRNLRRFLVFLCSALLVVYMTLVSCFGEDFVVLSLSDIEWGERGGGNGFPEGLQTYRFAEDKETGGVSYYARFPAGSYYRSHWHTHDEIALLVEGRLRFVIDDVSREVEAGTYFFIPGGHAHEWDMREQKEDIILLVQRKGPPDFHFAD